MGHQPDRHPAAPRQHRLDKIAARLELLEGYIIAYLNLDRIIEIIRPRTSPSR
jgi:topoisomerase-4 subunit A